MIDRERSGFDKEGRLIDRYIHRQLSGAEREEFETRLKSDAVFRSRVELRRLIIEGIRSSADEALEQRVRELISYRKSRIPFGLKILLSFLTVVICGILVWNYLGVESHRPSRVFDFRKLVQRATETVTKKKSTVTGSARESIVDTIGMSVTDTAQPVISEESSVDDSLVTEQGEEIVVKKDQLLIGFKMDVKKVGNDEPVKSMAQETARQLNPDAGLPEGSDEPGSYEVEFWVNPVNYRGYRLSGESLILFGLENPDECGLVRFRGNLYLLTAGDCFRLDPTAELKPYYSVKDPEVLKSIR